MERNFKLCETITGFPLEVKALYTTRLGGVSKPPFYSFNLGDHVNDDFTPVQCNRQKLEAYLKTPVVFMNQTHSTSVKQVFKKGETPVLADGIVTTQKNLTLAVMTADCLPLLLASADGKVVGAIHCGWRGLAFGIVENALKLIRTLSNSEILAYTGACIAKNSYEVGGELVEQFSRVCNNAKESFVKKDNDKFLCDLPSLCKSILEQNEVSIIGQSPYDTYLDKQFFSYRREHITGRQATLISIC